MKRQYNEKPAKHSNLGVDIPDAARHANDTYENPERLAQKRQAKEAKASTAALKANSIASLNESNFIEVIACYEVSKALLKPCFAGVAIAHGESKDRMSLLKAVVLSHRGQPQYNSMVDAFNRLGRTLHRNRWRIRSLDDARAYFEPKTREAFTETNGYKSSWRFETPAKTDAVDAAKAFLASNVAGVQFGNSIPDAEREYCLVNLADSIRILQQYFNLNLKGIGFSFGARGQAGSIAHYQDSRKVIAINRHWDGALIHELGHAIDYQLGLVSSDMPWDLQSNYRDKLNANKINNQQYYRKTKEIFARMFEVYIRVTIPECTKYMQTTHDERVMPEFYAETIAYMNEILQPIMKGPTND